jgi:spore maturation protein CgeB
MKIVVFGLTVSSSWGNGHATLWRGLIAALARRGVAVDFFERDVHYYAAHRDVSELLGGARLHLYSSWEDARMPARDALAEADVGMVTSYCPDGPQAAQLLTESAARMMVFYDLDTPVTLKSIANGARPAYLPADGLTAFDLVLSYTGGAALDALRTQLGARRVAPLYGHVDPAVHKPVPAQPHYRADLSYLGTYAADRQAALSALLIEPARHLPEQRFVIAGAQYPVDFPWSPNIYFVRHLPPAEHPALFASSRLTLNVTRSAMAAMGWCPSGRLFEAAACGCPVLSDDWEGLDAFFVPGREILVARNTEEAIAALSLSDAEVARLAEAARERTLEEHTSQHRADELLKMLDTALEPMEA